jgi:hypothetical protein
MALQQVLANPFKQTSLWVIEQLIVAASTQFEDRIFNESRSISKPLERFAIF